jgi:hypothetical protein
MNRITDIVLANARHCWGAGPAELTLMYAHDEAGPLVTHHLLSVEGRFSDSGEFIPVPHMRLTTSQYDREHGAPVSDGPRVYPGADRIMPWSGAQTGHEALKEKLGAVVAAAREQRALNPEEQGWVEDWLAAM